MWSFLSGTSWCYQLQQTSNIQFTLNFTSVHLIIQHHCKYRDYYGSKFRIRLSNCMYPGHIESKRKPRVRTMLLSAMSKILLFWAFWCINCMICLHPSKWKEYPKLLGDACGVFYQEPHVTRYNKSQIYNLLWILHLFILLFCFMIPLN